MAVEPREKLHSPHLFPASFSHLVLPQKSKLTNFPNCFSCEILTQTDNTLYVTSPLTVGWAGVAQSVWRLTTGWTVRDGIPVGTTGPVAHPASCTMGTVSFPGAKSGRGVTLTLHLVLVPWSRKSRAITLLPPWTVQPGQTLYKGALYLYLYLQLATSCSETSVYTSVSQNSLLGCA